MTRVSLILVALSTFCGCGVEMEEVKKELLPNIQANAEGIESMKKNQNVNFTKLQDNVLYMEKDISKVKDSIKTLRLFVEREIAEQNEHLAKVAKLEFTQLELEAEHLQKQLENVKSQIKQAQAKKATTGSKVDTQSSKSEPKPSVTK